MPSDPELDLRGKLVRSLGALREMLPGSFFERARKCGKKTCRCADGKQLHPQAVLSALVEGELKALNVPAVMADQVRDHVELRKRFDEAAAQIANINLRRFLRRKELL